MRDIATDLARWLADGEQVVLATVVWAEGPSPRPLGSRMAVAASGQMIGSVSGGCVEGAVFEEAQTVLAGGPPKRLRYGVVDETGWEVGLACGGTIDVSVQRLDADLVAAFRDHLERGKSFALVAVVAGEGAVGDSALITRDGVVLGLEDADLTAAAQEMLATRAEVGAVPQTATGTEAFIEPFPPPPMLLIIGGVHVGLALSRVIATLPFRIVVLYLSVSSSSISRTTPLVSMSMMPLNRSI